MTLENPNKKQETIASNEIDVNVPSVHRSKYWELERKSASSEY